MKSTILLVRLNVPDTPSEGRLGGRSVACTSFPDRLVFGLAAQGMASTEGCR